MPSLLGPQRAARFLPLSPLSLGLLGVWLVIAASCAGPQRAPSPLAANHPLPVNGIELGESFPVETELNDPEVPAAHETWLAMIASARHHLDIAQFYIASKPGTRMAAVLEAVAAAGKRGVAVRLLVDKSFCKTYPKVIERMESSPGLVVRRWDAKPTLKGILHAKYFIVDGERAWLGSQNFDWRSLRHIQELGLRMRVPKIVSALQRIFEADWALAGGQGRDEALRPTKGDAAFVPARFRGGAVEIAFNASPKGWLPDADCWDLPQLVRLIDGAKHRLRFQLLSYRNHGKKEERIDELEGALRRAGARGVKVEILLSNWTRRSSKLPDAQRLDRLPGVSVRLLKIPEAKVGHIPFARVVHAKYLVVDGRESWVGTSNWGWRYFFTSRNVGVVVKGPVFARVLDRFFERGWANEHARPVGQGPLQR